MARLNRDVITLFLPSWLGSRTINSRLFKKMATGDSHFDLSVVGKLKVYDKDGGQIAFEDIYMGQKTVIVFVRVSTY